MRFRLNAIAHTDSLNWLAAAFAGLFLVLLIPPPALANSSYLLFADQQTVLRLESVSVVIERPGHYTLHDPGALTLGASGQSREGEPSAVLSRDRAEETARNALVPLSPRLLPATFSLNTPLDFRQLLDGLTVPPLDRPPRPTFF